MTLEYVINGKFSFIGLSLNDNISEYQMSHICNSTDCTT